MLAGVAIRTGVTPMRLLPVLLVSMLLGFHVQAQPAVSVATPPRADTPAKVPVKTAHRRMSWQQRFAQANATHDGHLTLEQAKAGYVTVARHFAQIDTGKKGYVTQDDIAAWHKMQREARHHPPRTAKDALRPRPAVHRTTMQPGAMTPTQDGLAKRADGSGG
jgi:hypothetical protein